MEIVHVAESVMLFQSVGVIQLLAGGWKTTTVALTRTHSSNDTPRPAHWPQMDVDTLTHKQEFTWADLTWWQGVMSKQRSAQSLHSLTCFL